MPETTDQQIQALIRKINELEQQQELNRLELASLKKELSDFLHANMGQTDNAIFQNTSAVKKPVFSIEQFIGLKLLNFIGIVVLLIGIVIGVKFAVDQDLISPLFRIMLAYAAGALLLILSITLKTKYEAFSAVLFSGAAATFYFTTYGAFEFYGFLSRPFAFSLMVLFTIVAVWISLRYNRQEISILALVGAYGIPFLVGGNAGNIAVRFGYLFLINSGILVISFKKNWEWLKYLSFGFSWLIFVSWLLLKYDASWFATGLGFMIAFFVQFSITICGFRLFRRQELPSTDYLLVCLLNVFVYVSALLLYRHTNNAADYALVTLLLALVYLSISIMLHFLLKKNQGLSKLFMLSGLILLIVYTPIQLDGIIVSLIWIAGAIVLFIAGLGLKVGVFRFLSFALFGITLCKLVIVDSRRFSSIEKIITYVSIGGVLLVISFLYQKYKTVLFGKE
jgi:uncharacterized membrane protein